LNPSDSKVTHTAVSGQFVVGFDSSVSAEKIHVHYELAS